MKEIFLGDYDKVVPRDRLPDSNVEIRITPLDLVTYWKRVGILADFVAGFYSYSFLPPELAAKDITSTPVFTSISTVFNELVENAAKYSVDKQAQIKINLNQYGSLFKMQVENSTSSESAQAFRETMEKIFSADDLDELYFQKLEENSNHPNGQSGIGLMMVLKDYPVRMGIRIRDEGGFAHVLTEVYYSTED